MVREQAKLSVLVAHDPKLDPRIAWVDSAILQYAEKKTFRLDTGRPPRRTEVIAEYLKLFRYIGIWNLLKVLYWFIIGLAVEFLPVLIWSTVSSVARVADRLFCLNEQIFLFAQRLKNRSKLRPARLFIFAARITTIVVSAKTARENVSQEWRSHIYSHDFETLWSAHTIADGLPERIIYDAHEFYSYADIESRFWEIQIWKALEGVLCREVKDKFTVSPELAAQISKELGGVWGSVCNAIPLSEGGSAISEASHGAGPVRFIFQGRYGPGRGIEKIVAAFLDPSVKSAHLSIRVPRSTGIEMLARIVARQPLGASRIEFLPEVGESELVSALAGFDVGVIPYLPIGPNNLNCCPNKLSQYLGAGLAVISDQLSFVGRYLRAHDCGSSYSDHESLVRVINELSQPSRLSLARQNAVNAFRTDMHWEAQSGQLHEILRERFV